MKLLRFPYHPLLLSIYPIAHLYARNFVFLPIENTFRILAVTLVFALFFLAAFKLILKDWALAGVLSSLLVVLFYTFGHAANAIEAWTLNLQITFDVSILGWIWLAALLVISLLALKFGLPEQTTPLLNIVATVLVIAPVISIASDATAVGGSVPADEAKLSELRGEQEAEAGMSQVAGPDIYFIILDGYQRADTLLDSYGYDNSAFTEGLQERGFYLASSSRSNYLNTNYSLNTSLNLMYYHEFPDQILLNSKYDLQTNYVSDFLRRVGYEIVVFDSGSDDTNDQYADIFVTPKSNQLEDDQFINPFEQLLLRTTAAALLFQGSSLDAGPGESSDVFAKAVNRELAQRRELITHAFGSLAGHGASGGEQLLFSHIFLPHFPFLYGPDGEELQYHQNLNLYWYEVEPENYIEYYNYQLDYLNQAVLDAVDEILAASEGPVVIVLQSDHGDRKFIDFDEPTSAGVDARSAILNAIYYSDGNYESLYQSVTPVNTFRLIFNHWFGTEYPLLPDRTFFHEPSVSTPFNKVPEFVDACTTFDVCLPVQPND